MEFYTLEARTDKRGVLDGFHTVLFHGVAKLREHSRENPAGVSYWLGKVGTHSLEITCGGLPVPPIFMTETNLIVSQKVRDHLAGFSNLAFLPVVLKKLVGVHFEKGDFPYMTQFKGPGVIFKDQDLHSMARCEDISLLLPAWQQNVIAAELAKGGYPYAVPKYHMDPRTWIRRLPDVPELHAKAGTYYEVITARLRDIEGRYTDLQDLTIPRLRGTAALEKDTEELRISERMQEEFPVFWWGVTILSLPAFAVLGPNLDRDYFAIGHYKDGEFGEWDA